MNLDEFLCCKLKIKLSNLIQSYFFSFKFGFFFVCRVYEKFFFARINAKVFTQFHARIHTDRNTTKSLLSRCRLVWRMLVVTDHKLWLFCALNGALKLLQSIVICTYCCQRGRRTENERGRERGQERAFNMAANQMVVGRRSPQSDYNIQQVV